jgi:hypothetical protein
MENSAGTTGPMNFLFGKGILAQMLFAILLLAVIFFLFMMLEYLWLTYTRLGSNYNELVPYTVSSENKAIVIRQDSIKYSKDAKPILFSHNERTGIEFTYSFYLWVNPSNFTDSAVLYHIFHKGFAIPWPLMGPGVFMKGDSNTMRVYMNSYKNPATFCDIENIPIQKWVHVALICRKNSLEVYINGNIRQKIPFTESLPYQNFQDLTLFSSTKVVMRANTTPCLTEDFIVDGVFKGSLSNLIYLNYAASFTEINNLMRLGVSKRVQASSQDKPPYLTDNWWVTDYSQ